MCWEYQVPGPPVCNYLAGWAGWLAGVSASFCTHTHTNECAAQGTLTPPSERSTVPAFHYRIYLSKHRSVGKSKPLDLLQSAVEDPRCPSWSLRVSINALHDRVFILCWTANYVYRKEKCISVYPVECPLGFHIYSWTPGCEDLLRLFNRDLSNANNLVTEGNFKY